MLGEVIWVLTDKQGFQLLAKYLYFRFGIVIMYRCPNVILQVVFIHIVQR